MIMKIPIEVAMTICGDVLYLSDFSEFNDWVIDISKGKFSAYKIWAVRAILCPRVVKSCPSLKSLTIDEKQDGKDYIDRLSCYKDMIGSTVEIETVSDLDMWVFRVKNLVSTLVI